MSRSRWRRGGVIECGALQRGRCSLDLQRAAREDANKVTHGLGREGFGQGQKPEDESCTADTAWRESWGLWGGVEMAG